MDEFRYTDILHANIDMWHPPCFRIADSHIPKLAESADSHVCRFAVGVCSTCESANLRIRESANLGICEFANHEIQIPLRSFSHTMTMMEHLRM